MARSNDIMLTDIVIPDQSHGLSWQVLIVDDEEVIHTVTKLVLRDMSFENKRVEFVSAYSAKEACRILETNNSIAVMLLDVVMEHEHAGFEVVEYTRNSLNNQDVRIIMRTGQPGYAPERDVITQYDINDYKEKTELTSKKLFSTILTALRSYRDIKRIQRSKSGLEDIISTSRSMFRLHSSVDKFASTVFEQTISLLGGDHSESLNRYSGFAVVKDEADTNIVKTSADLTQYAGTDIQEIKDPALLDLLESALSKHQTIYSNNLYVGYFQSRSGLETLVYLRSPEYFNEEEIDLLRIFSSNVNLAFDNICLKKEIMDTQREILFTISDVVENRSRSTARHIKRVVEYSVAIGEALDLDDEELGYLRHGVPMHDIGKIGISDSILNKPGPLTAEEFEVMKTHTLIGHKILAKSSRKILQTGAVIALQHHERWDGSGYPAGLAGTEIDILARITSVADVYDALCQNRVYKEAWSPESACEYILSQSGSMFDPTVVSAFKDNYERILKTQLAFPDEDYNDT
ncbi:DUF3369 domain-containing protein [Spirochaeta dissipatitropha]